MKQMAVFIAQGIYKEQGIYKSCSGKTFYHGSKIVTLINESLLKCSFLCLHSLSDCLSDESYHW